MSLITIPTDIYESPREIVVLIPLWWVDKNTIEIFYEDYKLIIKWIRVKPTLKEDFVLQQDECYWGEFQQEVQLPPYVYFDRIHSLVSIDNILIVTIPKSLQPGGKLRVAVELPGSTLRASVPKREKSSSPKRWRPSKK